MEKGKIIFGFLYLFVILYSVFFPVGAELKLILPVTVTIPMLIIFLSDKLRKKDNKENKKVIGFIIGSVYVLFSIAVIGFVKNNPFEPIFIISLFYAFALVIIGLKEIYYSGVFILEKQ